MVRPKSESEKIGAEQHSRYRTGVGQLLYLIKHSRPDICNGVRQLTKVLDGPTEAAYREMLRVIKHVLDTRLKGLKVSPVLEALIWKLVLFSDSDWAGDKDDRKSVTGYMLFLNGVLISWKSVSQKPVALSSSEAEFYACSDAVKEIPFIVQVLDFLGVDVEQPVRVRIDNVGAIFMAKNTATRTRHMDTRYYFVKDLQKEKKISV